jgi:hypothetical protein
MCGAVYDGGGSSWLLVVVVVVAARSVAVDAICDMRYAICDMRCHRT